MNTNYSLKEFDLEDNETNISSIINKKLDIASNCSFKLKDIINQLSILEKEYGEDAVLILDAGDNNISSFVVTNKD